MACRAPPWTTKTRRHLAVSLISALALFSANLQQPSLDSLPLFTFVLMQLLDTFTGDFFGASPTNGVDNPGSSLLSEMESQQLTDFFNTGWTENSFMPMAEHKDAQDDLTWGFVPPATIHSVSTTIPDQSQLHHPFPNDRYIIPQPTNHGHLFNTSDDIRAASTLYNNAQMPQTNQRSHSFHATPNINHGLPTGHMNGYSNSSGTFNGLPMVPTPHGMINEQIAALLPRHDASGSVDAQLCAEFATSPAHERHETELREMGIIRPPLKRSYTYGTDSSFNESGFQVSSKEETEEHVTSRLIAELQHAQPLARPVTLSANGSNPKSPIAFKNAQGELPSDEEDQSEDASSGDEEDEDRLSKKRRKGKMAVKNRKRKTASTAGGKNRKASVDDRVSKKKRGSVAAQKLQRENLSEEQKRSNHILSEQKRRNLIKRGFDDLAELVPEIRSGGLSKSGVLTEAANFLESLITKNDALRDLMGEDDDDDG